eukprot:gene3379-2333_t
MNFSDCWFAYSNRVLYLHNLEMIVHFGEWLSKHVQHVLRIDCYSGWECVNSEMLLHTLQLFLVEWTIVVNAVWIKVWYLDCSG